MSRFVPSLICAILCATCVVLAFSTARRFSRAPDARFIGPGTYLFRAPEATEYTLWHDFTGSIEGEFSVREADLPTGTKIRITHGGAVVDAVADSSTSTASANGQRKSVLHFTVPSAGEYQIDVSGLSGKREFEITHGAILMPLLYTVGWIGGASLLALLTAIFAVLALLRIYPRKPRRDDFPSSSTAALLHSPSLRPLDPPL